MPQECLDLGELLVLQSFWVCTSKYARVSHGYCSISRLSLLLCAIEESNLAPLFENVFLFFVTTLFSDHTVVNFSTINFHLDNFTSR